jgi:hypothetical protein
LSRLDNSLPGKQAKILKEYYEDNLSSYLVFCCSISFRISFLGLLYACGTAVLVETSINEIKIVPIKKIIFLIKLFPPIFKLEFDYLNINPNK